MPLPSTNINHSVKRKRPFLFKQTKQNHVLIEVYPDLTLSY